MRTTLVVVSLSLAAGCHSGASVSGGIDAEPDTHSGPPPTYGASPCAACVDKACASPFSVCSSDAACASYLDCINACPLADSGTASPTCSSACPLPAPGASRVLAQTFVTCEASGPGATCQSCGAAGDGGSDGQPDAPRELDASRDASKADADGQSPLHESCPTADASNACLACEQQHCCHSLAAYQSEPQAASFADCDFDTCVSDGGASPATCLSGCASMYPKGFQAYEPFSACAAVFCTNDAGCGALTCNACTHSLCATQLGACLLDPDCFLTMACIGDSDGTIVQFEDCQTSFPKGSALYGAYAECVQTQCLNACE